MAGGKSSAARWLGWAVMALPGGWPAARGDALLNSTTAFDQRFPDVAALADGRFLVVWQSFAQDGDGFAVAGRVFSSAGEPSGPDFVINETAAGSQALPAVAGTGDGGALVVWLDTRGEQFIMGRKLDGSGSPSGPDLTISQTGTGGAAGGFGPDVAATAERVFVVWTDARSAPAVARGRLFDQAGQPLGGEFALHGGPQGEQKRPRVAALPDGRFVVVYEHDEASEPHARIMVRLFDAEGTPLGPATPVDAASGTDNSYPAISVGATAVVVAWYNASGQMVVARRLDVGGQPLGDPEAVSTMSTGTGSAGNRLAVASGAGDWFGVGWHRSGGDGSGRAVVLRRIEPLGAPVGGETRMNTWTAGDQQEASAACTSDGRLALVWASNGQDGSGWGVAGVFAQLDENHWRSGQSGAWGNAANWDFDAPAAGDRVRIDAEGAYTVTVSGPEAGCADIVVDGGAGAAVLRVEGALSVSQGVTVNGGDGVEIGPAGSLSVGEALEAWSDVRLEGGTLAAASVVLESAEGRGADGRLAGWGVVAAPVTNRGSIEAERLLTIGSLVHEVGASVRLAGADSRLVVEQGWSAAGEIEIEGGTLAGEGVRLAGPVVVRGSGRIEAAATVESEVRVEDGADLTLAGEADATAGGARITGPGGRVIVAGGGRLVLSGQHDVGELVAEGALVVAGEADCEGALRIAGTVEIAGGDLRAGGLLTLDDGASLEAEAGRGLVAESGVDATVSDVRGLGTEDVSVVLDTHPNLPWQDVEVISCDVGAVASGFFDNGAWGRVEVAGSVRLVDARDNCDGAEAMYAETLVLSDPGATLHLNGLNVYCRQLIDNGTQVVGPGEIVVVEVFGDFDGDGDVDIADFTTFAGCFGGAGQPVSEGCRVADFDGDGDVDIVDFNTFASAYTGAR